MLWLAVACRGPSPPVSVVPSTPTPAPVQPTGDTALPPDTDPPLVGSVEVGTGEYAFEALDEEQEVPIVFGPQGGYHMFGALRVCDLEPPFAFSFRIRHGDTGSVLHETFLPGQVFIDSDGECAVRYPIFGFLEIPGPELDGQEVEYEVNLTDSRGVARQDSRRVLARFTPLP